MNDCIVCTTEELAEETVKDKDPVSIAGMACMATLRLLSEHDIADVIGHLCQRHHLIVTLPLPPQR